MFDLGSELGHSILDGTPYPVFILSGTGRLQDANQAACNYFGQTRETLRGTDALGMRGYSPTRRAEFAKRFGAWQAGDLVPFRISWPPRNGPDQFIAFPQGAVAFAGKPAVALLLVPVAVLEAALAGKAAQALDLGRAQVTPGSSVPVDDALLKTLTPREWEIARRLAEGDRVPLIVEDLGIAENTVRNHLKSIFRKLHVSSQAQLVRRIKPQLLRPKGGK